MCDLLPLLRRLGVAWTLASMTWAGFAKAVSPPENDSLRHEVSECLTRGARWLESQQNPDGSWSDPRHPALSALALLALQRLDPPRSASRDRALQRGLDFLRSRTQPDGGIYTETLSNYNTALSLLALLQNADPVDRERIQGARRFLIQQQARGLVRPELDGGVGYGPTGVSPKRQHPDLDNTLVALEALRAAEIADALEHPHPAGSAVASPATALDWNAAITFVSRCQNLRETNPQPWVSQSDAERGGFVYYPGFSNAGEEQAAEGTKSLRSSGTMSYAGLLSFIYADLTKEDPRVRAALKWLESHYTLRENPGLGHQGLFYYYHLMAKGLTAAGKRTVGHGSTERPWAPELALELIQRQESAGFWVNDNGRWMEKDPVLVSAYSLLTLELLLPSLSSEAAGSSHTPR